MARTSQKLEVNSAGNVERRLVRNCMMANGLSKTLTYLIDKLSAEHQSNKVGSRQETLNLTSVLNNSPLNHLADMGVVCPESAKVDKQRVNKIIDSLRKISPDGIVDFYSLARLQSQNFRRDREKIVALKLSSFEGEFPEKYVRAYTSVILRFLSATLLPWGELSLMLLVLGHREPLSRRKILHLKELEAFFLHGERPTQWKREHCGLLITAGMVFAMASVQVTMLVPQNLLRYATLFFVKLAHLITCTVSHRLRFILTAPFGKWACANLTTRAQLIANHQKTSQQST